MLIGIVGGGQLGRMLALAGIPLGLRFRFLDIAPEAPAGRVGDLVVGAFEDPIAIDRFADGLDLVTYEFENVPASCVRRLAERVPVYPPVEALEVGQDRAREKALFTRLGLGVPEYRIASTRNAFDDAVRTLGTPLVIKTCRLGYDGKGQAVVRTPADAPGAWEALCGRGATDLIIERLVAFEGEVSMLACRGRDGTVACYPLVENVHRGGILRSSRVPSRWEGLHAEGARAAGLVLEALGYVGVLTIEFFVAGGRLLVNEMAPRVHNSGHWTIEGAATSQFENHLRAILGLPLGDCSPRGASVMVNMLGDAPTLADVLRVPGAHAHLYDKQPRPGRKIGHVTVTGIDMDALHPHDARIEALCDAATRRAESAG